jgi:diguanylate cyclase (GGDEF)-like protein/PAS domain S-box-containing protein
MNQPDRPSWHREGGTMDQLIRDHDWSAAGLGEISNWSQSLRTAVDMLLRLPLPAILLWGPGLVQIYNDHYRLLMGEKHSDGLGRPAHECWSAVWDFNDSLYESVVQQGESFTFEDKRVVLDRDGGPEEGFFTLKYSPMPDGEGGVAVLVTVEETTDRVRARRLEAEHSWLTEKLSHERTRLLEDIFRQAPLFLHVLRGPDCILEFANAAFYRLVGDRELVGRPLFEALPEAASDGLQERIAAVLATGEPYVGWDVPMTLARAPGFAPEERRIDVIYQPLFESDGSFSRVLGHGVDVTEQVRERQRTERALAASRARFQTLASALAAITAARHRDEVMEIVRTSARQLTGADGASLVLKDGGQCHYVSEDSPLGPLWQGQSFSSLSCISGWAMRHGETAIVENVHADQRFPSEFYKPTFVRSLIMVPLGSPEPFAAVGAYWSRVRRPDAEEVAVLEALTRAAWDVLERRQTEECMRQSEERLAAVFARAPVGLAEISLEGQFLQVNSELCNILGRSSQAIEALNIADVTFEDDVPASLAAFERLLATGEPVAIDTRYLRSDGSKVWASSSLTRLDDNRGRPTRVLAVTMDLTERVRAEEALRASEERYRALADLSPDGILVHIDGIIQYANAAAVKTLGARTPKDLLGVPILGLIDPAYREFVRERIKQLLERQSSNTLIEERWRRIDGSPIDLEVSAAPIEWEGRPALQVLLRDITERKQVESRIWQHANFCPLTQLPNRRLFRDRLDQEVKKAYRAQQQIGLLFIDLDGFKQVNDLLGHDAGDQLLVQAARRLESCVRESDTVARLGGDEFTVILGELGDSGVVEKVAQSIVEALSYPFYLGEEVAYVSGSVGITLYPDDATTSQELIRKADQAMYSAKGAGKNQFSYFTRAMDEKAHLRLRLANELRGAIRNGQLEVYYQPVVDLSRGCVDKAEALVRWRHPDFGLVEPSHFIPLAEESGLISEIGNWVFREAAVCAKRWCAQLGAPFQVSVNKSPMQFLAHAEDEAWLQFLQQLGLSGSSISVEITEGVLLHASRTVTERLLEYRDAGIQVAIDDFGTGYSSMAYLKKFDIDYLKIDRSFVSDMAEDHANRTIAETIIVMAHKLGLKVIAEGIETEEQKRLLKGAGCDYGQGFLFSHPVPAAEFEELIATMPRCITDCGIQEP